MQHYLLSLKNKNLYYIFYIIGVIEKTSIILLQFESHKLLYL